MVEEPADVNPYQPSAGSGYDVSSTIGARNTDLTTGDWLLAALCSSIACIIGIMRLVQGKPNGLKLIAVSLLFAVFWSFVQAMIVSFLSHR